MSFFIHPGGWRLIATVFSILSGDSLAISQDLIKWDCYCYIPLLVWFVYSFQKRALAGVPWFHVASKPGEGHMPSWGEKGKKGRRKSTKKSLTVRTSINYGLQWTLKYDFHSKWVWLIRLKQIHGNYNNNGFRHIYGILFMFFWLQNAPNSGMPLPPIPGAWWGIGEESLTCPNRTSLHTCGIILHTITLHTPLKCPISPNCVWLRYMGIFKGFSGDT